MNSAVASNLDFSFGSKVPIVLQSEVAECGLACIAMVGSYLGHSFDIGGLRRRFSTSLKGLNLKHLIQVADQCDLASRAVRCDLEELSQLQLPAILHWDLNHFVVLTKVTSRHIVVHDPAIGKVQLSPEECSQHFTGIALELQRSANFSPIEDATKLSIWQLWSRVTHLGRTLAILLAMSLLLQLAGIAAPYYMQWVVDHVLVTADQDLLVVLALGFGFLMLTTTIINSLRSWLILRISSVMNLQMGVNLLQHLLCLPMDYFEKRHVGDVVSRFSSLSEVRERLTTGIVETIVDGVMSVLILAVMFLYSTQLTLLVLAAVLVYFVLRALSYGSFYRANESVIRAGADEQTNFLENIRGIQTIKLFNSEGYRLGLWQNRFTDVINGEIRLGKLSIGFSFVSGLIFGFENILVIFFSAQLVLAGKLTIGMVLAYIAYKNQLTGRLSSLVEQWIAFRMLRLHLNRIADIALAECEPSFPDADALSADGPAGVKFESLNFRYGDNEPVILSNVNMAVEPGEIVAIVGPSGSGKTTLVKLLLGLLRPSSGRVTLDGKDLQQLGTRQYREQVAAVMQSDSLLAGSVSDNISFFDLEPDQNRIEECARMAEIDNDIQRLPMGYRSLVGDMGNQFSGGQVQRLMLARALYQAPRLLVLDEATSHLDIRNEQKIADQIRSFAMTRIIVAHRPETVRKADKIFYVNDGSVTQINQQFYKALNGAEVNI